MKNDLLQLLLAVNAFMTSKISMSKKLRVSKVKRGR